MAIRLVILDVEGVIAPAGGGEHPWDLEALLQVRAFLAEHSVPVALCTGRQLPYAEAVIQALGLFYPLPDAVRRRVLAETGAGVRSWPSIVENGGLFLDPLAKQSLPHPALTPECTERLRRLQSAVLEPLARQTRAVVEVGKACSISLNPPPRAPGDAERQSTDTFRPTVEAACAGWEPLIEIRHSRSAVDITPRGISKASAVRHLLHWTGVDPAAVLGVGDTPADAAWLGEVGVRAAPANGRPYLAGLDHYAASDAARGLLEILRRYLA